MIPPTIAGLINYLSPILAANAETDAFSVWDGEVPRFDESGHPVGPSNQVGSWPVVMLAMQEPGFTREHVLGADAAKDDGTIMVKVWATTRADAEKVMNWIEEAFEKQVAVYTNVNIGGPPGNPNYIIQMTLVTYGCWQDAELRTATSEFLYRGDTYWTCSVHTNAPTSS